MRGQGLPKFPWLLLSEVVGQDRLSGPGNRDLLWEQMLLSSLLEGAPLCFT